ncbi:MAG: hypothetical protein O3C63_04335 [Cyanobacteria bacterium]|nr:hypothetical protein [Cyanobacteriota bacterium]
MFGTLKNAALNFLGRVPFIKKFVPEKYKKEKKDNRPELQNFHRQESRLDLARKLRIENTRLNDSNSGQNSQFSTDLRKHEVTATQMAGKDNIKEEIKNSEETIISNLYDLTLAINERITRENPNAPLLIDTDQIKKEASISVNTIIESMQRRLQLIEYKYQNIDHPNPEPPIDEYLDLLHEYISNSTKFILEVNNRVLKNTISVDTNVTDYDIAKALEANREISKALCSKILDALKDSKLKNYIIGHEIKTNSGSIQLPDYLRLELAESIKALYLGSQFGIHSETIINLFKDKVQNIDTNNPATYSNSCKTISQLQKAIHGSILQNPTNNDLEDTKIGEVDSDVFKQALKLLVDNITKGLDIKHNDQPDNSTNLELKQIEIYKLELARLLTNSSDTELLTQQSLQSLTSDNSWDELGLNTEEQNQEILNRYAALHSTDDLLGTTSNETILGKTYPGHKLINTLRIDGIEAGHLKEHFERLIYETSLVALIDRLTTHRSLKSEDSHFALHPNFEKIDWLKSFYIEKYNDYKTWLEPKEITTLNIRRLGKELAHLGKELHNISGSNYPLFELADMCSAERYNITDAANAMLKRVAKMTDIGRLSLHLELANELFANLQPNQEHGLDEQEVKQIKDLVEFLKNESILRDDNGKQIIAPLKDKDGRNSLGMAKSEHMKKLIGSRGFLLLNTPIIVKFLKNSLDSESKKPQTGDGQSIEHRNSILASLLFYILVKYLPAKSNDIDSLKARALIFKTLMSIQAKGQRYLPILYNRMQQQGLGMQEGLNAPHMDGKPGIYLGLSQDIETKLLQYPEQLNAYNKALIADNKVLANQLRPQIQLKDLLEIYQDLDQFSKKLPKTIGKIEGKLSSVKNHKQPLLRGIKEIIKATIESDTLTVVNFVKNQDNKELTSFTHELLLDKAAKLASRLVEHNLDKEGNLLILDSHQNTMNSLISLLIYTKQAARLIDNFGISKIRIQSNGHGPEHNNNVKIISDLIKRRVVLITNAKNKEVEEFPAQAKTKMVLVELLKEPEFKFRPVISNIFSWHDISNIKEKIQKAKEAEYTLVI